MDVKALREQVKDLKVLFVEDELEVKIATANLLERFFDELHTASNGEEGLELFEQHKNFDVVISDIKMPKLDGFHMAVKMKQNQPKLYIAFLTGSLEGYLDDKEVANKVIIKPLLYENIIELISEIAQFSSK
jgi:CheY-like chemotaxis protein